MFEPIPLDHPSRRLRLEPPGQKPWWTFHLIEDRREYTIPVAIVHTKATPDEIARSVRGPLYNFVSSNWLDENWKTLELAILAQIKKFQKRRAG